MASKQDGLPGDADKFPDTLFVTRDVDDRGDTIALQTDYAVEDIDERQDGSLVAVYELVRVERLNVAKVLLPR